jgi:ATP-dependent exoDNAse (exonuclease V) beta subunit
MELFKGERGKYGLYDITAEDGKKYKFPSVTTILGMYKDPDLEKFFEEVSKEDQKSIMTNAANRGTAMHQFLENYAIAYKHSKDKVKSLLYTQAKTPKQIENFTEKQKDTGMEFFYNLYHSEFTDEMQNPLIIEGLMVSRKKGYAGRTDLIYGDHLDRIVVSDYKSSGKRLDEHSFKEQKYTLQLAAYMNAYEEMTGKKVHEGVVWVGHPNGYQKFILHRAEYPIYLSHFLMLRTMYLKKHNR